MKSLKIVPLLLLSSLLPLSAAEEEKKPILDTEAARTAIEQIQAAKPRAPRKVLVYSVANGFAHDAIDPGKKMLTMLGEITGAFTAVVNDDPANFEKDQLEQFDAVIFNNTTGSPLLGMPKSKFRRLPHDEKKAAEERDARLRQNLLDYIENGGGFAGIHAATDTYKDWEPYTKMIGGKFAGHPWHSHHEVVIDVVNPLNAVNEGVFPENPFTITEEIYVLRDTDDNWVQPDDRKLLLKLNKEQTQRKRNNIEIVPIAWIKNYGQGRVFYSSLGHNVPLFESRPILEHYLRGIQFAVGDLRADATPGAE